MTKFLNAEEVLDLMLNYVSLSRYDQKFFSNLQITNVLCKKPITSNQASLFSKVVKKYKKQLASYQFDADQLAELPWTLPLIQSSPEYTHAYIGIENNELILRCPFKQAFVQEFRECAVMIWDREKKLYNTEYGLYKLKIVISCVMKHYAQIKFCDKIREIIDEVSAYSESDCWNPTLTKCNGRLYIFNLNEPLEKAISHIELDTKLSTLAQLSSFGIMISQNLYNELLKYYHTDDLNFAVNRTAVHEVSDIIGLADKLKKINCDYVIHTTIHTSPESKHYVKTLANLVDFPVQSTNMRKSTIMTNQFDMPVVLKSMSSYSFSTLGCSFASKIVNLVNSKPVEVK